MHFFDESRLPESLTIRPVVESDAETTASLLNAIIATGRETVMDAPIAVEEQRIYIRDFPARGVFLSALVGAPPAPSRIAGIQSIEPIDGSSVGAAYGADGADAVGEISTFVAEQFRGRGIGRTLTKSTLASAAALGFRRILAVIRADNPPALAFYERMGFRASPEVRRRAPYRGGVVEQIVAELGIPPRSGI